MGPQPSSPSRQGLNASGGDAADHAGRDPDRVSFVAALRISRRSIAQTGARLAGLLGPEAVTVPEWRGAALDRSRGTKAIRSAGPRPRRGHRFGPGRRALMVEMVANGWLARWR